MSKYRIGLYFPPGDTERLYKNVMALANDPLLFEEMKKNVEHAFTHLFNSEIIYDKFVDHLEFVAKRGKS
jgi:hypothetical protein